MDHPRGVKVPSSLSPQPSRPWLDPLLGMLAAAAWVVFWAVVDWLWPTLPPWIPFAGKVATLGAVGAAVGAALARWRARSLTDPLTGLGNRRVLQVELDRTLALAKRHGHPLAVVLIDVNDFKAINDTRGHGAGDRVLRQLASLLETERRASDVAVRMGGDEFLLVLPFTAGEDARHMARRLQRKFRDDTGVELSFGVSAYPADGTTPSELLEAADRDLYRLKGPHRSR